MNKLASKAKPAPAPAPEPEVKHGRSVDELMERLNLLKN